MGGLYQQVSISTQLTISQELKQGRVHLSDDAKRYNNDIFKRVIAICPAWKQAFSTKEAAQDMRREWLIGFADAKGITSETIEYALSRLRKRGNPFMPSIGEFLAWCDEGRLPAGTKNEEKSFLEVIAYNRRPRKRREPSELSAETYHTLTVIDGFYFRGLNTGKAEEYWSKHHKQTLECMKNGQPLNIAPPPAEKIEYIKEPSRRLVGIDAIKTIKAGLR